MASVLAAELNTLFDPIDSIDGIDFDLKVLLGDIEGRIASFAERIPSETVPSQAETEAAFAYMAELAEYAKDVAAKAGIDVDAEVEVEGETFLVYDFSVPSYADFVAAEDAARDEILQAMPDFPQGVEPFTLNAMEQEESVDWLAKLLAALGVGHAALAFLEALKDVGFWATLKQLIAATRQGLWRTVRRLLRRLLELLLSKKFLTALANRVGSTALAKRLAALIGSRLLPWIGWALVIGAFIYAIAKQYL
jgi:hypothetical protein